jgi:hypothetical protein
VARRGKSKVSQAWITLNADDPEALSAWTVARDRLAAARHLTGMRRWRVIELVGPLPGRDEQETLLHRSIQFYNPHKERCTLRLDVDDETPLEAGEQAVLVIERGGERRPAAERWWSQMTGRSIEVREGVAWGLRFVASEDARARARELIEVVDRGHGLLCNACSQEARFAGDTVPLPWMERPTRARAKEDER